MSHANVAQRQCSSLVMNRLEVRILSLAFGEKMAGKGDTYRQVDQKKWDENWERVFGDKHRKRNASSNAKSISQRKKKTTTNNKRKRQGVDQSNTERKKQ